MSRQAACWPLLPFPQPNVPGISVRVDVVLPLAMTASGNSNIPRLPDRFSRCADMYAATAAELTTQCTADVLVSQYMSMWVYPVSLPSFR